MPISYSLRDIETLERQLEILNGQPLIVGVPSQPLKPLLGRLPVGLGQEWRAVA